MDAPDPASREAKSAVARGYDSVAETYAQLEVDEWPRLRRLRELLADLRPGSSVLDLGCGSAVPAGPEIARAHRLTGVDISARQLALARDAVPEGTFVHADATTVDFPQSSLDAVVSFYAFDHIPRAEWSALLRRIRGWLRPGGELLISVEDVDQPGTFGTWLGVRMYFSSFDLQATRRLVEEQGFEVLVAETEVQQETAPGGSAVEVPYVWIRARSAVA